MMEADAAASVSMRDDDTNQTHGRTGKDSMAQVRKVAMRIIVGLFIVVIVSFTWGRLRAPTQVQAQAIALLKPVPLPTGAVNAWATFWMLGYDIPPAQVDAAYAQEREHLQAWAQLPQNDDSPSASYVSRTGDHFPKRPAISTAQRKLLCQSTDPDCLGKVRANLQPLRELLASQSGRVTQVRAIPINAVMWDDTPNAPNSPFPDLGIVGNVRLTAAALDFVDDRKVEALAQVCRDARTVRHLHAHTNSVIGPLVANSWMYPTEQLLAGMLTELPPDQPIPDDCAVAFAPVTRADVTMCAPLQREYEGLRNLIADTIPDKTHRVRRLAMQSLLDVDHSSRLIAPTYAWACQPTVIDSMLADRPVSSAQKPGVRFDLFDALSNPVGVILARTGAPDYAKYLNRNEDYAASLRATAWLLAQRGSANTAGDWRAQLTQARPALQMEGRRDLQLDTAGNRLIMRYRESRPSHPALELQLMK